MLSCSQFWLMLIGIPIVALLPDLTYMLVNKVFYPSPTDSVLHMQQKEPQYKYMGFESEAETLGNTAGRRGLSLKNEFENSVSIPSPMVHPIIGLES